MILGDLGADVVRLEAPDRPDLLREHNPAGHRTINRNKRSIIVNLKESGASDFVINNLLPHFDILVEQFRPGVMQRLGLAYEDLQASFQNSFTAASVAMDRIINIRVVQLMTLIWLLEVEWPHMEAPVMMNQKSLPISGQIWVVAPCMQ